MGSLVLREDVRCVKDVRNATGTGITACCCDIRFWVVKYFEI